MVNNKKIVSFLSKNQFLLFILVGAINTIFGYSVFALFVYIGIHYVLAVFFATCIGVLFNFKTIGKVVFKNSENSRIFKFIMVYAVQYLINISLIKLFILFGSNTYIAGAFSTFFCAILSYFLNKNFVFMVKV